MRERIRSYSGCVLGCIPSFCWIIKRKDPKISIMDVAHTGRTTYIYVFIILCIFFVLFPHLIYFITLRSYFSNNWFQSEK
jgi:hypothetical protein